MKFSDKAFAVLDALDREQIFNQRQLAKHAGVSLGQVNYILKSLIERGFVKVGNFRKNPHKEAYVYLLTPSGIRKKSALAVKFVLARLEEYERVRGQLAKRLEELDARGHKSVIFVGPGAVKKLMEGIIEEKGLRVRINDYFGSRAGLQSHGIARDDVVLLFDGTNQGVNGLSREWGLPRDRIHALW